MKAKIMIAVTALWMSYGLAQTTGNTLELKANHPNAVGGTVQGAQAMPGGGKSMLPMHEYMQKMRTQMDEINKTEDPDKRDELIESHMADMQSMMKMMGGQQDDKVTAPQGGMMEMMSNQQMMKKRMDMMQMMMDQMMQSQAAGEETRMIRERRHDHRKMK